MKEEVKAPEPEPVVELKRFRPQQLPEQPAASQEEEKTTVVESPAPAAVVEDSPPRTKKKLMSFSDDEDENDKPKATAGKVATPKAAPLPSIGGEQAPAGGNRLMNMINSLFSVLKRPAKKPERKMVFNKEKGRYEFDGESESEEEEVKAPPKKPTELTEEEQAEKDRLADEKKKEGEKKEVEGANAFM